MRLKKRKNLILFILSLFSITVHAVERQYNIELVVFSQNMPNTEVFEQSKSTIAWPSRVVNLSAYKKVPKQQLELQGSYSKLARSDNYQTLMYASWTQSVKENSLSNAVKISNSNGTINGFFRIQRGHLVNMIADIEYSPDYSGSTVYHLKEKRRFKLNEMHYLDHPKFGILARISPVGK